MRKIVMFNLVSLDGYFARPNGEIDWHMVDDEFNHYAIEILNSVDTILFGRVTYQMFESYWPRTAKDIKTGKEDHIIADKINKAKKIVFSKTLKNVTWENSQLIKEHIAVEVARLKAQAGGDIVIYGSGTIVQLLTNLGLIDEYIFLVNPVILGEGKQLFKNIKNKLTLKLHKTKEFTSGSVLLDYTIV